MKLLTAPLAVTAALATGLSMAMLTATPAHADPPPSLTELFHILTPGTPPANPANQNATCTDTDGTQRPQGSVRRGYQLGIPIWEVCMPGALGAVDWTYHGRVADGPPTAPSAIPGGTDRIITRWP
ncbi:hypothetical protein [Spongiactinospora sp. 9N601]|uniref:hypothetical protein n=1 Tax=Spongiactinospora sp. 9N601 TaxID=3375149 RepID=UPI00378DA3A4